MAAPDPARQRDARRKITDLIDHAASAFVIHYACQALDQDQRQGSPRVTSIAVSNLETGRTESFSIHEEVELAGLGPVAVLSRLDQLERTLLDKFFAFIAAHRGMRFAHWNMRNAVYGFSAIEHRYVLLGGDPVIVTETQQVDIARAFIDIYGTNYVEAPRFVTLAKLNSLPIAGMLAGRAEADSFEAGEYIGVQRSTLTKVRLLSELVQLAHGDRLETRSGRWIMNVGRVREAWEMLERNPLRSLATLAFAALWTGFEIVSKLVG